MTIQEIWQAIDEGKKVFWHHDGYKVHQIEYNQGLNKFSELSLRNGKAIRVSCIANYFGSLISESDLKDCFIGE